MRVSASHVLLAIVVAMSMNGGAAVADGQPLTAGPQLPGFTFSGTVVNERGERLRPVRAVVRREDESVAVATNWSSSPDGRFVILNLAPGRYRLFLEALPFETKHGRPLRHFARVSVRPAPGVPDLSVVAAPGVTLSGELVFPRDSTPAPLHNVWVVAAEPEGRTSTHELVRADRTFALADVFGIVRIGLSSPPDGFTLRAVRLGEQDITGRLVEIEPNETRPLRLELAPARQWTRHRCADTRVMRHMIRTLHEEPAFADRFITHMLGRNIRIEEDLVDQLFNSSEKRLARTLLLLARYGKDDTPVRMLPKLSQETLAEMVGTTRSRVNFFMNKFRKLGFIEYNGGLKINRSLLSIVLHE